MATHWYTKAVQEIATGVLDMDAASTLKVMLVTSSYTPDPDHEVVDAGGANDPVDHELNVTGYTRGFGGAGRKAVACAVAVDNTNNRVTFTFTPDPLTWTGLGTGQTIAGAILIKEITNDAASRLIAYWDLTDTPTNNGDVSLDFATAGAGGNLQINVISS